MLLARSLEPAPLVRYQARSRERDDDMPKPTRRTVILGASALGGLMTNNGAYFGMQDIIHSLGRFAIHPNADYTRFYIGSSYNNMNDVKF